MKNYHLQNAIKHNILFKKIKTYQPELHTHIKIKH